MQRLPLFFLPVPFLHVPRPLIFVIGHLPETRKTPINLGRFLRRWPMTNH